MSQMYCRREVITELSAAILARHLTVYKRLRNSYVVLNSLFCEKEAEAAKCFWHLDDKSHHSSNLLRKNSISVIFFCEARLCAPLGPSLLGLCVNPGLIPFRFANLHHKCKCNSPTWGTTLFLFIISYECMSDFFCVFSRRSVSLSIKTRIIFIGSGKFGKTWYWSTNNTALWTSVIHWRSGNRYGSGTNRTSNNFKFCSYKRNCVYLVNWCSIKY